ncbi:MAG: hypothetical protein GF418_06820 [Chitinivibrionales bacterium]|nr:hypothetical protein [Chitinivibrionales bacterium]MBD3395322.1 hypothetical protein [Chitinivibrionales bacterium]
MDSTMYHSLARWCLLLLPVGTALFLGCGYPADSGDRDLIEIERVWQYLKVYSLYSSQVPDHEEALTYNDPSNLVAAIPDTLYSHVGDTTFTVASYLPYCPDLGPTACAGCLRKKRGTSATVFAQQLTDNTVLVRIDSFNTETDAELRELGVLAEPFPNVILDLSENPGGSLESCTAAVELFLPAGIPFDSVVRRDDVQETGDTGFVREIWSSTRTGDAWEGKKIAVLIHQGTASAAEILAASLRYGLGDTAVMLVGMPSYGKSIGQYRFCLWRSSGAELVLTGFRFFPLGDGARDYHERGIVPDDSVSSNTRWGLVAAAGAWLEPGFEGLVPQAIQDSLSVDTILVPLRKPRCYTQLPDWETPPF